MPTAVNTIRSGGALRNNDLSKWAAGVPEGYASALASGTLTQLTREMQYLHRSGIYQPQVALLSTLGSRPPAGADPLIWSGKAAARFQATGAWAANQNGLRVAGPTAALVGAANWGLPYVPALRHVLTVVLRGTNGKQVFLKLAMRDSAGANPVYLQEDGTWTTTEAGGPVFSLSPFWQRYSVEFLPTLTAGMGAAGLPSTDALVFGIFNLSTAGAGNPFVFDIDSFEYEISPSGEEHQEA